MTHSWDQPDNADPMRTTATTARRPSCARGRASSARLATSDRSPDPVVQAGVSQVQSVVDHEEGSDTDRDVDQEDPAQPVVIPRMVACPAKNPPTTGPRTLEVPKTARK